MRADGKVRKLAGTAAVRHPRIGGHHVGVLFTGVVYRDEKIFSDRGQSSVVPVRSGSVFNEHHVIISLNEISIRLAPSPPWGRRQLGQ